MPLLESAATTKMSATEDSKDVISKSLGRLGSGVYIVTTDTDTGPHGMLATWVMQAAFAPPMVTISINNQRPLLEGLEGKIVTVNVLSKANMDIFKAFAKPSQHVQDDRFEGLPLASNPGGAATFANAISALNCRVVSLTAAGDHTVAVAEVLSGLTMNLDAEPMVHFRKNGFQY